MKLDTTVLASGNLASPRRIIAGLLAQLTMLQVDTAAARAIFTNAGLPARALAEPDFPVSLQQELEVLAALVAQLPAGTSPIRALFAALPDMGIENLGVVGMAMRHAATALDVLKVPLAYPELTMGHCRLVVRRREEAAVFVFSMDRPTLRDGDDALTERLMQYCVVLDLTNTLRNLEDVVGGGQPPLGVTLPYPRPPDWERLGGALNFPVEFGAAEASIAYPAAFDGTPPPQANPILFKMYTTIADKLSLMLAEEVTLQERVLRWLWAYTPPPGRAEVAELLAMSERNLTRQLAAEGTSFSSLLARVQAERAGNLLRSPALSVAEIGYRLGYTEPAAFTRAFTRWTGQSPLRWRRAHLEGTPPGDRQ
ncbi:MAG: AraC family transcriptional regulator ligand-binding domain-containing protein [Halieaceae bacterium]|nr:AraC family transcriptional regulator ligand-binding domain-containing protein [Halieaceae bacterium]MCP5204008.1 AraC family transcriptional regulator ligand-binding domain-containing protein [Pseudomonadales bacterium]